MKTMSSVDLVDAQDANQLGAKAANLGDLIRAGYDVPAGFVLPAMALSIDPTEALGRLQADRFAVRSSAIAEDLAEASFAGQYETVLNVPRQGIADAIRKCRKSASAHRIASYREAKGFGGTTSAVAVIVQEMVDAEAAGVAFSADPVTGARDRILVSAVRGLGERLVSGEAAADEWWIESGIATCRAAPEQAIDGETALRIAALARSVTEHFGAPQDIEWAVDRKGHLLLLQARPMTALPPKVRWESPDGSSYRRNIRLGEWFFEPLTPLFADWLVKRLEASERARVWRESRIFPVRDRYSVLVNGWYFLDLGFLPKGRLGMVGLLLKMAANGIPRAIAHPDRAASALLPPTSVSAVRPHLRDFRQSFQPSFRELVEGCRRKVQIVGFDELVAIVDRLADAAGEYFFYVAVVGGYGWKSEHKLARFFGKHLTDSGLSSHQELVLGCRLPSAPPPHQVTSLDWYRPLPAETDGDSSDPDSGARHMRLRTRREAAEAAARSALSAQSNQLRQLEARLAEAQEFAAIREELIAEFTLGWPVMRIALHRLGEDLVRRNILTDWRDIFFLTREELISASEDLAGVAAERKTTWDAQRRLTPPLHLGPPQPMYQQMVDGPAEAFRAPAAVVGLELLRGMPCSPGVARGRVRVIYGPEGFDSFKAGEVLVAPATTPGWTPLFARAVAVITDTGSVTAHASLVAREYGIPAVVSTGDATQKLRDGMLVTVDGSAGVVLEDK